MPDTKLTMQNIRDHLRKYGVVYVVLIVVASVVTSLLWTMTTPVIPDDERILIYLADAYSDVKPLEPYKEALLERARAVDPKIREVAFESLMFSDPENDYTGVMLMMTRLVAGEGDMFIAGPDAMTALVQAGACLDLEALRQGGWLSELEPYYADYTDPDTEQTTRLLAGVKLDPLHALLDMMAFRNEGACLALPVNSPNNDSAAAVAGELVKLLEEAGNDA